MRINLCGLRIRQLNINLRELEFNDLEKLNDWRNNPNLVTSLGTGFTFISKDVDKAWYNDYLNNRDKAVRLVIDVEGVYVGNINLTNISQINRSAEFSIFIGDPNYQGKGVGSFASSKIIDHGIKDLGLRRFWLTVLVNNQAAIAMYKKIGFEYEGTLRQAIYKEGEFYDMDIMSLIH